MFSKNFQVWEIPIEIPVLSRKSRMKKLLVFPSCEHPVDTDETWQQQIFEMSG